MARSTVAQVVQVGREVVPGTAVVANRRLGSLSLAMSSEVESEARRVKGSKYPTYVVNNKEWSTVSLEGTATYDEIVYPLSSAFTAATVTAVMDGATPTGVFEWTFSPATTGADAPVTFTIEEGDAAQAERIAHVLFTDFGLEMSRSEVTMSGEAFGQRMNTGLVLNPSATAVAANQVPILPGQVCIYVSDTRAGLGTPASRQGKALSISPSISGRYSPVWYLNCTLESFGAFVETPEPDFTLDYMVEADANGLAWLDRYRTGVTQYVRIEATGPTIYNGTTPAGYLFQWDAAVKTLEPGAKSDEDGVYAISPSLQVVHDATWGRATQIKVRNTIGVL